MKNKIIIAALMVILSSFFISCMGDDFGIGRGKPKIGIAGKAILIYEASDGNDMEIYAADIASGQSGKITNNSTADRLPFPTPDGGKIAWACDDGNNYEVCVLDVLKGKALQVTKSDTDLFPVAWIDGGKRLLVSSCADVSLLKTDPSCMKTIYDLETGANREIARGKLSNLPPGIKNLFVLSVSPESDLLLIGDEERIIFLNSKNFSVRQLNAGALKFVAGPWLGRDAVLLTGGFVSKAGENISENQSDLYVLNRSGQTSKLADAPLSYAVCSNYGFAKNFTACTGNNSCIESERWEGTSTAVVALESDGRLIAYDVKTGTRKTGTINTGSSSSPQILCNGSNRIVVALKDRLLSISRPNLSIEESMQIEPGDFANALSPDGAYLALTFSSFDKQSEEGEKTEGLSLKEYSVGMPAPSNYVKFAKLPKGPITKSAMTIGEKIQFTKDGKYAVSEGMMFDPKTGSVVEMPATIARQREYGPMPVSLDVETERPSVPFAVFDISSGDSLSLAGEIPVSLTGSSPIATSWIDLTKEEFSLFIENAGKAQGFSPEPQKPKMGFLGTRVDLSSSGYNCLEGNNECFTEFIVRKRGEDKDLSIAAALKSGGALPGFLSFDQRECNTVSHYDVPGIKDNVTTCKININASAENAGAYDIVITVTDNHDSSVVIKELHIDIP